MAAAVPGRYVFEFFLTTLQRIFSLTHLPELANKKKKKNLSYYKVVHYLAKVEVHSPGVGGSILSFVTGKGAVINSHFLGRVSGGGQ